MATVITTIRPTTEQQAVNIMLGAIGEDLIDEATNLAVSTDANVLNAVAILKETVRELLTAGWRFNTLTGYEIAPTSTYSWTDTAGATALLNVFKVPVDVLAWTQTPCSKMAGIELVERLSLKYTETVAKVMVLFDRVKNRDGVLSTTYPYIYLDAAFAFDFEKMPECARKYAAIASARRLAQRVPASSLQTQFTQMDEGAALRVLKREQGLVKALNLFQTADAYDMGGRRPFTGGGFSTTVYPGGTP